MTTGNGTQFQTEYLRAILKRPNIALISSKARGNRKKSTSPVNGATDDRDKPIKAVIKLRRPVSLDENFDRPKPEKTVTFREPMTVNGSGHMAKKLRPKSEPKSQPTSAERVTSETKQRSKRGTSPSDKSDKGNGVVQQRTDKGNGVVQQRPRTYERAEHGLPKFGTIRKSYEPDKKFRPLAVFRAFERTADTDTLIQAVASDTERQLAVSANSEPDMEATVVRPVDDKSPKQQPDEDPVSIDTFPYVGDDEIDKHKKLNAEAEHNGNSKSPGPYDSYLKRLKLERKALEPKKPKDQRNAKRKPVLKKLQTRARWGGGRGDIPDIAEVEKTETPPPPKPREPKASRILLDFKYSHAVEQLYSNHTRQKVNFSPMSDSFVNYSYHEETEVKNGHLVKTMGANVLNLRARTLPSCNPFEMRMRRQLARERAILNKKASTVSQSSVKSHLSGESLLKLRRISASQRDSLLSNAFTDDAGSESALNSEHGRLQAGRKSVDSQASGLPDIRIERPETLATRSLNSSPDGPEYMRKLSNHHTKTICLNLPSVVMEDL